MPEWLTPELQRQLLDGIVVTVVVTAITTVTSMLVGIAMALGRRSTARRRRYPAATFVEIFRNVPALIWIIFFAFALPNLLSADRRKSLLFDNGFIDTVGDLTSLPLPYYAIAACVALTCNTGAHLCELIRSGMDAVPVERVEMARTLGASRRTSQRTVLVPDAIRQSFPAISNRLIHNLKNTSLVSFVAVPDLFSAAQGLINRTFQATEVLVIVAVLYLALAAVMGFGLARVESWLTRGRPVRRNVGL